jgi:hypothetical protein
MLNITITTHNDIPEMLQIFQTGDVQRQCLRVNLNNKSLVSSEEESSNMKLFEAQT